MAAKTAFFTVVYPGAEKHLDDFFLSLKEQTYRDFDLIIINDQLKKFLDFIQKYPSLRIIEIKVKGTPAENRAKGFEFLAGQGYENVVLGDADDYYESNRIETSLAWLKKYDIVANEFDLIDNNSVLVGKNYLSPRLGHGQKIEFDFLRNKNIFGFGNTAIRGRLLDRCRFVEDIIAIDWFLFSCLLKEGCSAVFVNDTKTYHRIYGENTLSLDQLTPDSFKKGLDIKIDHFKRMVTVDVSFDQDKKDLELLRDKLQRTGQWTEHIEFIKGKVERPPFWLEEIQ